MVESNEKIVVTQHNGTLIRMMAICYLSKQTLSQLTAMIRRLDLLNNFYAFSCKTSFIHNAISRPVRLNTEYLWPCLCQNIIRWSLTNVTKNFDINAKNYKMCSAKSLRLFSLMHFRCGFFVVKTVERSHT